MTFKTYASVGRKHQWCFGCLERMGPCHAIFVLTATSASGPTAPAAKLVITPTASIGAPALRTSSAPSQDNRQRGIGTTGPGYSHLMFC